MDFKNKSLWCWMFTQLYRTSIKSICENLPVSFTLSVKFFVLHNSISNDWAVCVIFSSVIRIVIWRIDNSSKCRVVYFINFVFAICSCHCFLYILLFFFWYVPFWKKTWRHLLWKRVFKVIKFYIHFYKSSDDFAFWLTVSRCYSLFHCVFHWKTMNDMLKNWKSLVRQWFWYGSYPLMYVFFENINGIGKPWKLKGE